MKITRVWAMPNGDTFSICPIGDFLARHLLGCKRSIDPFARNSSFASHTNDLNPATAAQYHLEAGEFLAVLSRDNAPASFDALIFDPPYSPRQISDCYQSIGKAVSTKETQNGALYKRIRDAADPLIKVGGKCLSFGWHSNGMGKGRGWEIEEILLVAHGGAHNDTICVAERKVGHKQGQLL